MMRLCEKSKQVTTEEPCAAKDTRRGLRFDCHCVRVNWRDLKRTLYGCGRSRVVKGEGVGVSALELWCCCLSAFISLRFIKVLAKARSAPPPNQLPVVLRSSLQRIGSESIIARQALLTRVHWARDRPGRKLRMIETSSAGSWVRKSRERVGARIAFTLRRTGMGDWRRKVRITCDWRDEGRAEYC
jgi:hypothetical protein